MGSTGSIGTQALEVLETYPDYFDLQVLTAYNNVELLIEQAKKLATENAIRKNSFDIAKVMKKNKVDMKMISKFTGLSVKEIEKL